MAPLPLLEYLYAIRRSYSGGRAVPGLDRTSSAFDFSIPPQQDRPTNTRDESGTMTPVFKSNGMHARSLTLQARAATTLAPSGQGVTPPEDFNNAGMLALFAILGAGMVAASLWFFFWAKNGGFQWRKGDWEDYKSTVLRRKGPDGKTLSNATRSTKLGGGTIAGSQHYKWQQSVARSVVGRDEKGRKGVRGKRGWAKTHSVTYSNDYLTDSLGTRTVTDMTEVRTEPDMDQQHGHHHSKRYRDRDVQDYKREKPARVGGMNRVADGSHYDYSLSGSDLMSEAMTESSEQPMLQKPQEPTKQQRRAEKEQERSERKAREQAAKMERRWKREAEKAAASLTAASSASTYEETREAPASTSRRTDYYQPRAPPTVATTMTATTTTAAPPPAARRSAAPAARPSAYKARREHSPKKSAQPHPPPSTASRDFSYTTGDASEVLSTIYSASETTGTRAASYYDEYRPRASEQLLPQNPPRSSVRQSSPRKKAGGGGGRYAGAGYRRGGVDSDLE